MKEKHYFLITDDDLEEMACTSLRYEENQTFDSAGYVLAKSKLEAVTKYLEYEWKESWKDLFSSSTVEFRDCIFEKLVEYCADRDELIFLENLKSEQLITKVNAFLPKINDKCNLITESCSKPYGEYIEEYCKSSSGKALCDEIYQTLTIDEVKEIWFEIRKWDFKVIELKQIL